MAKAIRRKRKRPVGKLLVATQIGSRMQGNSRVPIWILQFDTGKSIRWEGPLK